MSKQAMSFRTHRIPKSYQLAYLALEAYIGELPPFEKMDLVPDPRIAKVFAAKLTINDKPFYFLVDLQNLVPGEPLESAIEEVEFTSWPPTSK